jgi:hypothetical protein
MLLIVAETDLHVKESWFAGRGLFHMCHLLAKIVLAWECQKCGRLGFVLDKDIGIFLFTTRNQSSLVSTVTKPWAGWEGQGFFSLSACYQPWGPPSFLFSVPVVLFLGVNLPGCEADHSLPSSAEVRNASTPPYIFMGWCLVKWYIFMMWYLVKHRNNFTCFSSSPQHPVSLWDAMSPRVWWLPRTVSLSLRMCWVFIHVPYMLFWCELRHWDSFSFWCPGATPTVTVPSDCHCTLSYLN